MSDVTEAQGTETRPSGADAAEIAIVAISEIAEIDVRLAELTDLFRRRLLEDRNNKATLDALHEQLKSAHSAAELQFLMPLIRRLFNVIDRLGSVPGEFADSVVQELTDILAMYEVTEIVPASPVFDPATQEAVSVVGTDRPDQDGRVAAVRRRGWRHGGRVLRPMLVDVGKLIE